MDAATRVSRYSAVLVERMWTMLEEEKTKVGGSYPFGVVAEANDLSYSGRPWLRKTRSSRSG